MKRNMQSKSSVATFGALCLLAIGIAGTTIAGIQGSGFVSMSTVGRITEPDSVTVNGVQYASDQARITIDGSPANGSALQVGQVVRVHGRVSPDGTTGIADEVEFVSDVRGEITARDVQAGTFAVLAQTVRIDDETLIAGGSADLPVGTAVEVSGFANSAGELIASRVDVQQGASTLQVRGAVAALDTNARTFLINTLLVDYENAEVEGNLADGAVVFVQTDSGNGGGVLVAERVNVLPPAGASGEQGDVEGVITSFASDAEFEVNGQRVVGDERTDYRVPGNLALGPDVFVQVSGTFEDGVLVAEKVKAKKKAK
jgi:Domain of unknown function (DUF5666)